MVCGRFAGWVGAALLVLAVAAGAPAPAQATVLYEYHSFCEVGCDNVGLAPGDPVGGIIGFSDEAVALGAVFDRSDVEFFDLQFGIYTFGLQSLGSAFAVFTGNDREAFSFQFFASASGSDPGFAFTQTFWIAGASILEAANGGTGSLRRMTPEPAPWSLLAAGIAAWLLPRRRRAAGGERVRR